MVGRKAIKVYLPCAGGLHPFSVVKCILTEGDCNLSRVKSSSSLVPRKKDTLGHSHTISLVRSGTEKTSKICPTLVVTEPVWLVARNAYVMMRWLLLLWCNDVVKENTRSQRFASPLQR